ncbi:MAG TPA: ABC transporter ATP-binding protein [Limnochordales bacterium]
MTKAYRDGEIRYPALRGIDLQVHAGEFVALMGPSGSGKSTLLHLIGGLDRPDAGQLRVAGHDLPRMDETALALFRRHHVGIIFQYFNLLHHLDALTNVMLPALLAGAGPRAARARALALFERLGVAHLAGKRPPQLSGGERQRVAIARALINGPRLLLADEPTGSVDQDAAGRILDLLAETNAAGQTILLVTHDPAVAARARRVLELRDGRILQEAAAPA